RQHAPLVDFPDVVQIGRIDEQPHGNGPPSIQVDDPSCRNRRPDVVPMSLTYCHHGGMNTGMMPLCIADRVPPLTSRFRHSPHGPPAHLTVPPFTAPTPPGAWEPGAPPAGAPGRRRAPSGRLRPGRAAGRTRWHRDPAPGPDRPAAPSAPGPDRWPPDPAP